MNMTASRTKLPACMLLACSLPALAAPTVEVSSQLGGEYITWYHDTSIMRSILYVTNHEPYSVICDSQMTTHYKDKTSQMEIRIVPGKTESFRFHFNKSVTSIKLQLTCIPDDAEKDLVKKEGKLQDSSVEKTTDNMTTRKLKPEESKPVEVEIQDLGQF